MMSCYRLMYAVLFIALVHAVLVNGQCSSKSSRLQFRQLTDSIEECTNPLDQSSFYLRGSPPLSDTLYDSDDKFVGVLNYEELDNYCSRVKACKEAIIREGNCDSAMEKHINEFGTSLCGTDGKAKREAITSAVSTLKSNPCDQEELSDPNAPMNEGCFTQVPPYDDGSYLGWVSAQRKRTSSYTRCTFRWLQRYQCSAQSIKALAVVSAAIQSIEMIGVNYDSFTSYDSEVSMLPRETVSMYGLTHVDAYLLDDVQTCALQGDNVYFFNPYILIDGTSMLLQPTSEFPTKLSAVTVTFRNDDGTTLETYSVSDSAELSKVLPGSGSTETSGYAGYVRLTTIDENTVRLFHSVSGSTVIISQTSDGLQLYVRSPKQFLENSSAGILVSGCSSEQERDRTRSVAGNDVKRNNCSNTCSGDFKQQCVYDCVLSNNNDNKLSGYQAVSSQYKTIETTDDNVKSLISAASPVSAHHGFTLLFTIAVFIANL